MAFRRPILVLLVGLLSAQFGRAQTASLRLSSASASPGGLVSIDLSLTAGEERPASLQWQIAYSTSDFSSLEIAAGPAAVAAGKTVQCQSGDGVAKCVAIGLVAGELNRNPIENGVVAHLNLQLAFGSQSVQSSIGLSNTLGASPAGDGLAAAGSGGTVDIEGPPALFLRELHCDPSWITAPGKADCSVVLNTAAPQPLPVMLSTDTPLLTVPSPVVVAAGSAQADFEVTASAVSRRQAATITALSEVGGGKLVLTLAPPARLLSMVCDPAEAKPGASTVCTIRLTEQAPPPGVQITLSSTSSDIALPMLVNARFGLSALRFRADISPFAGSQGSALTARFRDSTVRGNLSISGGFAPVLSVPADQTVIHGETVQFQVSARDPSGLPVTLSASLPPGASFTSDGVFRWTPQTIQMGAHTVQFRATNSIGMTAVAEVSIHVVRDSPVIVSLAHSASLSSQAVCAPGGLASLFGTGLTRNPPASAAGAPLPLALGDLRVRINGDAAPLLFASSTQVNFQCPLLEAGTSLLVSVESDTGQSAPARTQMAAAGPGIFTLDASGQAQGAILRAGEPTWAMIRNAVVPSEPVLPGDHVSIFATGPGAVAPPVDAGQPAPLDELTRVQSETEVWIAGRQAVVQFAGLAPGFVGLYQINARVPEATTPGDEVPVKLQVRLPGGSMAESNQVTMAVDAN